MKTKQKKAQKIRDLRHGEVWEDKPEVLTIVELENRQRLADYYARRAGASARSILMKFEGSRCLACGR